MSDTQEKIMSTARLESPRTVHLAISDEVVIRGMQITPGVAPLDGTSQILAQTLYHNREIYSGGLVIDLACPIGIQGIVMRTFGAKQAIFAGRDEVLYYDVMANLLHFGLVGDTVIAERLFDGMPPVKAKCIVYNPSAGDGDTSDQFDQLLAHAREYLEEDGVIITTDWEGRGFDAFVQPAAEGWHGLSVLTRQRTTRGLRTGEIFVCQLA